MLNSVIRTKTIFLFGAYPEYLQKKVIKEMRRRKYTVKQPKTLNGLELDGDDVIVVDVRDMNDWKEQNRLDSEKMQTMSRLRHMFHAALPCQEEKYWSGQKSMPNISKKQLKNVAAGKTEWHYPKKNTKKKLKQRQIYC